MKSNSVSESIDIITYLIDNSSWGKNTTCKTMLQLVYDECRELEMSLSNSDINNIIEETSDVNMMLVYFCYKLPDGRNSQIKKLFLDSVVHANHWADQIKKTNCNTEELYRMVLSNYIYLTNVFEDADSAISNIYSAVKKIVIPSLVLVRVKNNNNPATIDMVFKTISNKLRRRYAVYFKESGETVVSASEDEVWKNEKALEKDFPFLYCNYDGCRCRGKLGGYNIQVKGKVIFCKSCGNVIERNSIVLPQNNSKQRRKTLEEFERNLVNFDNGDTIIVDLYVFNNVEDCIDIFSDLICNSLSLTEFISYFSKKCIVSEGSVERFLCKSFYRTFAFDKDTDGKQRQRAEALRHYIKQNPTEFINLIELLKLSRNELELILYSAMNYFRKYYHGYYWEKEGSKIRIDFQKKIRSIFHVLMTLYEIVVSEKNVLEIELINLGNSLLIPNYKNLLNYIFVKGKYGIQRIIYNDESD